ncbi:MAG: GTP-binding protein [Firmicutes bacterium]|nr:GTP-binding protein [Bacillota bacterium]
MTAKIVYYGPGLCGKTTNLNAIYGQTSQQARGEMVSLNTETDRTLFFDLLPLEVGIVGGFKAKLQLYTVPGQVFYNSTRKLVLKGVDGIVFVADSQMPMLDANKESYQNLEENLRELGVNIREIPMIFQWNKRDLKNVLPVEQLEAELNQHRLPSFQSVASDGTGVFETLRGITRLSLAHIKAHHFPETTPEPAPMAPPPPRPTPSPVPLALHDLPSMDALMDEAGAEPSAPASIPAPTVHLPSLPAGAPPKVATPKVPLTKMPSLKPAKAQAPAVAKPAALPKPKVASPKTALGALLNNVHPPAAINGHTDHSSPTIRLELPLDFQDSHLELVVQARHGGRVVAEKALEKVDPSSSIRLNLEWTRSEA